MIFKFLDVDWTDPKRVTFSNGGYPRNTELVAENRHMIVVKVPGHSFWSSIAHRSYAPATYQVWIKPEGLNSTCGRAG